MRSAAQHICFYAKHATRVLASAFVFASAFCCNASAQAFLNPIRDPIPGFAPPGVYIDNFLVNSAVSIGLAYDSNIYESHSHPVQDYIFFVSALEDLVHQSGRSTQELVVSATNATYFKSENDDYTDVYVSAKESFLITPTTLLFAGASVSDGYQRRVSINFDIPSNAASPVPELILLGYAGVKQIGPNFEAGATVTYSQEQFSDVYSITHTLLDQQFRNEQDLLFDSFFNIQIYARVRSSLVFQAADIEYKLQSRNFDQWRLADTITLDVTPQTSFGVLVEVREQYLYNNPAVQLGLLMEYEAQLEWHPNPLLIVRVIGGYHDLGIDYVTGIYAGGFAPHYGFDARYSIWNNLQLGAGVDFEKRYLVGNADVEDVTSYKAIISYELSSYAGLSFLFNNLEWNSRLPNNSFNETIFQSSLNLRF